MTTFNDIKMDLLVLFVFGERGVLPLRSVMNEFPAVPVVSVWSHIGVAGSESEASKAEFLHLRVKVSSQLTRDAQFTVETESIMSLSSSNMYSIAEHPAEDDFIEEGYSEISTSVTISDAPTKFSTASLAEESHKLPKPDPQKGNSSTPVIVTGSGTFQRDIKRLSVSLFDIPNFDMSSDSGAFKADNGSTFANMSSFRAISEKNSKSYLEVQDCISPSNHGQTPLSATDGSSKECAARKDSDNLVFIDLNEGKCLSPEDACGPSVLRGRSRSVQWIQNTFQNVSSKYKWLLEIRRPSDIVEERMRKSREELEMEEPEYDSLAEKPSVESRRFSENIAGTKGKQHQKRLFPRLGHLWRDKSPAARKQEEKDSDQHRPDVCPLFTFPRKGDEDEQILDALRQAMRKCTVVDPTARPTSSTVLDQLSKLLD